VAIVIAVAEAEVWLPPGGCIGGQFPFGLCNFGESLAPRVVRLLLLLKAASLARGYSGVREEVIDGLLALHNAEFLHLQLERKQLDLDLSLASGIQQMLLPRTAPRMSASLRLPSLGTR